MSEIEGEWTCPKCQAKNDPDFSFCRLCGEKHPDRPPVDVTCAACGAKHPAGTCCPMCGSKEFLQL